jgi:xanthine dehydrogenase accessory factor
MLDRNTVVLRGGGDLASGIACRLHNAGFKVLITEIGEPTLIRRTVSFAQAVYTREASVEGITARLAGSLVEALMLQRKGIIPVIVDEDMSSFRGRKPHMLVDAILAKRNLGTRIGMADIVVGVGPGFTAGADADAVVETMRGHDLGRVILRGSARPNTGIPGSIGGYSAERVIRAPKEGNVRIIRDIGSLVKSGDVLALVDGAEARTEIDGVVRGMIQEGFRVCKGMKMADVDPRGDAGSCFTVSDKARSVGGGVLEALMQLDNINAKKFPEAL